MDLGDVDWLQGISIVHDRVAQMVSLSQMSYIETIVCHFNLEIMHEVWMPMEHNLPLSHAQSPNSVGRVEEMASILYQGAVVSAIYVSLCMRLDVTFAMHKLTQCSVNPGMAHWLSIQSPLISLDDATLCTNSSQTNTSTQAAWLDRL